MQQVDWGRLLKWPFTVVVAAASLWVVFRIYVSGQPVWAMGALALITLGFFIYLSNVAFAYRYLFPGLAGMVIFVAFPLLYTMQIGFTNYSSANLLTLQRVTEYLLEQAAPGEGEGHAFGFTLHADGTDYRIVLAPKHEEEDEDDKAKLAELRANTYVSPKLALLQPQPPGEVALRPFKDASFQPNEPLP